MNKSEIVELLAESGLEDYKDRLEPWIYPSLQIHLQPEQDDSLPLGGSKVGGCPDLPPSAEWPQWKQYNMSPIAQINLGRLPAMALPSPLPAQGLLTFFYAAEAMFDGDFYNNPKTCRVIYTSAEQLADLHRRALPAGLSVKAVLRPNRIDWAPTLCVPASESAYLESMGLGWNGNREDFDKYWSVFLEQYRERAQTGGYVNRLLGHPEQIQGDMQVACELMSEGLTYEMIRESEANRRVVQSALKWRLLLQIDSEEDKTGMMWGDVGRIYFWIREDDLAGSRFDRVVCEMQCT